MFAMAIVFQILMTRFQWGRSVFSIGGNETAALFSGIAIGRVKSSVYLVGAVLASFAGVVLVIVQGQGKADLATGYELDIIASAVVGGREPRRRPRLGDGRGARHVDLRRAAQCPAADSRGDVLRSPDRRRSSSSSSSWPTSCC